MERFFTAKGANDIRSRFLLSGFVDIVFRTPS